MAKDDFEVGACVILTVTPFKKKKGIICSINGKPPVYTICFWSGGRILQGDFERGEFEKAECTPDWPVNLDNCR